MVSQSVNPWYGDGYSENVMFVFVEFDIEVRPKAWDPVDIHLGSSCR